MKDDNNQLNNQPGAQADNPIDEPILDVMAEDFRAIDEAALVRQLKTEKTRTDYLKEQKEKDNIRKQEQIKLYELDINRVVGNLDKLKRTMHAQDGVIKEQEVNVDRFKNELKRKSSEWLKLHKKILESDAEINRHNRAIRENVLLIKRFEDSVGYYERMDRITRVETPNLDIERKKKEIESETQKKIQTENAIKKTEEERKKTIRLRNIVRANMDTLEERLHLEEFEFKKLKDKLESMTKEQKDNETDLKYFNEQIEILNRPAPV